MMNVLETFVLFIIMIVVFWFFGLIGLAILGLILLFALIPSSSSSSRKRKKEETQIKGTNIKPCHAHGLSYCPYCYPNITNKSIEEFLDIESNIEKEDSTK